MSSASASTNSRAATPPPMTRTRGCRPAEVELTFAPLASAARRADRGDAGGRASREHIRGAFERLRPNPQQTWSKECRRAPERVEGRSRFDVAAAEFVGCAQPRAARSRPPPRSGQGSIKKSVESRRERRTADDRARRRPAGATTTHCSSPAPDLLAGEDPHRRFDAHRCQDSSRVSPASSPLVTSATVGRAGPSALGEDANGRRPRSILVDPDSAVASLL
jgi:hypothetical protein